MAKYLLELEGEVERRKVFATQLMEIASLKDQGMETHAIQELKKLPPMMGDCLETLEVEDYMADFSVSKLEQLAVEQLEKVSILEKEIETVKSTPYEQFVSIEA